MRQPVEVEQTSRSGPWAEATIVTGGARGIGRSCALRIAEVGYGAEIRDVDHHVERTTAREITNRGGRAHPTAIDVVDETAADAAVSAIEGSRPPKPVLVNNAGIRRLTPMKRRERGAIVNVVSNAVAAARLHNGAYAAAKLELLGLTHVLALELVPHRIRANTISPARPRPNS